MQVEGWRAHRSLAQHDMYLPSMMGLMVEAMADGHGNWIVAFALQAIHVNQFTIEKAGVKASKEGFDLCVFLLARRAKLRKFLE